MQAGARPAVELRHPRHPEAVVDVEEAEDAAGGHQHRVTAVKLAQLIQKEAPMVKFCQGLG